MPVRSRGSGSPTSEMEATIPRASNTKWSTSSPTFSFLDMGVLRGELSPCVILGNAEVDSQTPFSPGRFFAVNEVKAMLSHILMTYDFRLADGVKESPQPHWINGGRSPNAFAKMEFRKRQKV